MDLEARAFTKRNGALWPSDFAADEYLAAIPDGREVLVRCNRPRSVPHHRWFFALLRKVVNAEDQWTDEEDLLEDLKDATGHIHPGAINPLTGHVRRKTRSINFAAMGEDKFRRFRDRCVYILCSRLGYDPVELMEGAGAIRPVQTQGAARRGRARRGRAGRGLAWHGKAWPGEAWRGEARQGTTSGQSHETHIDPGRT